MQARPQQGGNEAAHDEMLQAVKVMVTGARRACYLEYCIEDRCYFGEMADGTWIIIREAVFDQAKDEYACVHKVSWQESTQVALDVRRWRWHEGRPVFRV